MTMRTDQQVKAMFARIGVTAAKGWELGPGGWSLRTSRGNRSATTRVSDYLAAEEDEGIVCRYVRDEFDRALGAMVAS